MAGNFKTIKKPQQKRILLIEKWLFLDTPKLIEEIMIYFIKCQANGNTFIKIGRAEDLKTRLGDLQVACPLELSVLEIFHTKDRNEDIELEGALHEEFKSKHERGEWFNFGDVRNEDFLIRSLKLACKRVLARMTAKVKPVANLSSYRFGGILKNKKEWIKEKG